MKKILLLGGSAQQVVAIEKAKKMGYYTILCDYLSDNPGQYVADKFYLTSTTDKEAVLKIAQREEVNGVLAYASDPAAPTAAYVAEYMGLPSNLSTSVEILCNKDQFREFLSSNGFNTPFAKGYQCMENALNDKDRFRLPVIVKPVDSSGSKGITVLYNWDDLLVAMEFAISFSRSHRFIIEEYIEKKHPYLIGGDIFVYEGKIILWGLLNCHRDSTVNPLVPVGKSYPLALPLEDVERVKETLQMLVSKLHIRSGAMNVELVIDIENRVWPIDVGPRNGGNMIPDLLGLIFDIDVVEMSIKTALGMEIRSIIHEKDACFATHNIHADKNGKYAGVSFSDEIESHVIKKCLYKKQGDPVEYFDNAAKALGIVFLKFDDYEQMQRLLSDINKHIKVIVQ
ncbi:MAG: ATP-grasp domain-containing protein [Agathobacter sp.]